ncbi:hypothetical protein GQ457_14G016090 [Hibiscus cannabinus]
MLFHNYLPTFENLQQRGINVRNTCPFCEEVDDSNAHFLQGCSFTRNLLNALHIHVPDSHRQQDYKAWLANFLTCSGHVLLACEDAISQGFRSIQVDDSLTVIKMLLSSSIEKSIISPIVLDITSKLGFFENVTFSHVGRQDNQAAHALAKEDLYLFFPKYWIEEVLMVVKQIALRNLQYHILRLYRWTV